MKNLFLILVLISLSITSCSKDDAAPVAANPAVQTCFLDSVTGTYVGVDGNTPLAGDVTVKITKTGCPTITIESAQLGNRSVASLQTSAPTAYQGKLSDGSAFQLTVSGADIEIQCTGYAFSGTKQ